MTIAKFQAPEFRRGQRFIGGSNRMQLVSAPPVTCSQEAVIVEQGSVAGLHQF